VIYDAAGAKTQTAAVRAAKLASPCFVPPSYCVCLFFFLSYTNISVETEGRRLKKSKLRQK